MKQPIEHGRGHHGIAHHLCPGIEALVGGDDEGGLFVQFTDQVEEQIGLPFFDGRVADLIDDDQVRFHDSADSVFRGLLHLSGFQEPDQVSNPLETDLVSFFYSYHPSEG